MQIEMTIKGLMVDSITNMPIIILRIRTRLPTCASIGFGDFLCSANVILPCPIIQ